MTPSREPGGSMPAGLPRDPEMTFDSVVGALPPVVPTEQTAPTGSLPSAVWRLALPAGVEAEKALERYRFRSIVGRGGYGEVWEAVQLALNRTVAVKQLHIEAETPREAAALAQLFRHEAFTTAALDHPNIVPVYDFGIGDDGRPMLAMKLVRGRNWRLEIAQDFLSVPPEDFLGRHLQILSDVTQAVVFAHAAGIVHRDLKPGQVMLGEYGEVLLMDWGLAIQVDSGTETPMGTTVDRTIVAPTLETASSPAGTPSYMAPEQTQDTATGVGTWTDVYLLGGILYTLLTGTPPHAAETPEQTFLRAQEGVVEEPRQRAPGRPMPEDLVRLAMAALQPDPARRVPSAAEFLRLLREHITGASRRAESMAMTAEVMARATPLPRDYEALTELVNQIGRARLLWPENPEAAALREELLAAQAGLAMEGGDLLLARVTIERLAQGVEREGLKRRYAQAEVNRRRRERERGMLRLATATLLLLILGGGSWFIVQLSRARETSERARVRADKSRERAEDLLGFMIGDLRDKLEPVGRLEVMDAVSSKAQAYLATLPSEDQTTSATAARARTTTQLADLELDRGRLTDGLRLAMESEKILSPALARDPGHPALLAAMADLSCTRGRCARDAADLPEARRRYEKAAAIAAQLLAQYPEKEEFVLLHEVVVEGLTTVLLATGSQDEVLALSNKEATSLEEYLGRHPGSDKVARGAEVMGTKAADVLEMKGRLDEARAGMERCLDMANAILARDPKNAMMQRESAVLMMRIGGILNNQGQAEKANELFSSALPLLKNLSTADPTNHSKRRDMMVCLSTIATYQEGRGLLPEAEQNFAQCVATVEELAATDPDNADEQRNLAIVLNRLALVMVKQGKTAEGVPRFERSLKIMKELTAKAPDNAEWKMELGVAHTRLGDAYQNLGQRDRGSAEIGRGIEILRGCAAKDPRDAIVLDSLRQSHRQLADCMSSLRQFDAAIAAQGDAVAMADKLLELNPKNNNVRSQAVTALLSRSEFQVRQGYLGEAEADLMEALARAEAGYEATQHARGWVRPMASAKGRLAALALREGDVAGARALITEAFDTLGSYTTTDTVNMRPERETRARLLNTRALISREEGDPEAARADWEEAQDLLKNDTVALLLAQRQLRATALVHLGRREEAEPLIKYLRNVEALGIDLEEALAGK